MRIAQENGNGHAMAHALAWLHMVMASQRHPKAVHVLQRCAATCADHGLSLEDVEASVNLSIAKAIALTPSMPGCSSPGGGDSPAVTRDRLWACLPPSPQTSGEFYYACWGGVLLKLLRGCMTTHPSFKVVVVGL